MFFEILANEKRNGTPEHLNGAPEGSASSGNGERLWHPAGTLLVAKARKKGLWRIQGLLVQGTTGGCLEDFILGFGRVLLGEVYVLTSDSVGPAGSTGKVHRLVRPGA